MLKIEINTTKVMRYNTVGDYFVNGAGTDVIEVVEMGNPIDELLIAVHELVEWVLCKNSGITCEQIDAFDFAFKGEGEPGDEKDAPYYDAHQFATAIEMLLCGKLGLNWQKYLERTNNFSTNAKEK